MAIIWTGSGLGLPFFRIFGLERGLLLAEGIKVYLFHSFIADCLFLPIFLFGSLRAFPPGKGSRNSRLAFSIPIFSPKWRVGSFEGETVSFSTRENTFNFRKMGESFGRKKFLVVHEGKKRKCMNYANFSAEI